MERASQGRRRCTEDHEHERTSPRSRRWRASPGLPTWPSWGPQELAALAEDIRRVIIERCSATGGHLAPSLGVVELTLALFKAFDFERDKLIWDVGHQAYAHKLLTGRPGASTPCASWRG